MAGKASQPSTEASVTPSRHSPNSPAGRQLAGAELESEPARPCRSPLLAAFLKQECWGEDDGTLERLLFKMVRLRAEFPVPKR